MAANTPVRQRTGTVDTSKAVDHREPAFLAPGRHDRSTIRLEVYFFLATRANNIAGRWAINDRLKRLLPGLVRLPFPLWTTRQTPRVPSYPHRSSTIDCPKISPGAHKKPSNFELAPTATSWRAGPPRVPLAGTRSRSRVRCNLSRIQPKQSASSTDWRQTTPTWSRLSPFMPISSARPDQGSQRSPRGIDA